MTTLCPSKFEAARAHVLSLMQAPQPLTDTAWFKTFYLADGEQACVVECGIDALYEDRFHVRVDVSAQLGLDCERAGQFAFALGAAFELADALVRATEHVVLTHEERAFLSPRPRQTG